MTIDIVWHWEPGKPDPVVKPTVLIQTFKTTNNAYQQFTWNHDGTKYIPEDDPESEVIWHVMVYNRESSMATLYAELDCPDGKTVVLIYEEKSGVVTATIT